MQQSGIYPTPELYIKFYYVFRLLLDIKLRGGIIITVFVGSLK